MSMGDRISVKNSQLTDSPVGTNQMISDSFNAIEQSSQPVEVQNALRELVALVEQLMTEMNEVADAETCETLGDDLESFVKEAAKTKPRSKMLSVTAEGLIGAAQTVAALTAPISASVKAVLSLFGVELP
jgi:hypothetical protein